MKLLVCVVFVVLVLAGRHAFRAYRRRLARARAAKLQEARSIRDYGLKNFASLSATKYDAITVESLERHLASIPAGNPDRETVIAMIANIADIGNPVDSFISEETEMYVGAPHSPVAIEYPVSRRRYIYGISKINLANYPIRVWG